MYIIIYTLKPEDAVQTGKMGQFLKNAPSGNTHRAHH